MHSDVVRRPRVGRAKGVGVEHVARIGAGLAGDRAGDVRAHGALGEHGAHPLALDRVRQPGELSGGGLRDRGARRDDGADHLEPVAGSEIAEGIVVGDELALGGRNAAHAARHLQVHRPHQEGVVACASGHLRLALGRGAHEPLRHAQPPPASRCEGRATSAGRARRRGAAGAAGRCSGRPPPPRCRRRSAASSIQSSRSPPLRKITSASRERLHVVRAAARTRAGSVFGFRS